MTPDDVSRLSRLDVFVAAATTFCDVVEQHDTAMPALLVRLHGAAAALHAAVLALPDRDAFMNEDEPMPGYGAPVVAPDAAPSLVSHEAQRALAQAMARTLGAHDAFHHLVAPLDAAQAVPASLAQELTLVHRDVRASLHALATQGPAFGVWHARTFFESQWNASLGAALCALEAHARAHGRGGWPTSS